MVPQSAQPQKIHYFILEDDQGRQEIPLTEASYSLGRGTKCDIRIRSQFVSRHHATLYRCLRNDGASYYRIVDGDTQGKTSANGLLINGTKTPSHNLKHGDEIILGPQVFAIYQYRQRDTFDSGETGEDPFDITLIDPSMNET